MGNKMDVVESCRVIVVDCPECDKMEVLDDDMFDFEGDDFKQCEVECEKCKTTYVVKHPDY